MRIIILVLGSGVCVSIQAEDKDATAHVFNRRVLLLNFENQSNDSSVQYLAETVPEALIQPLTDTRSFDVLSRDISKQAVAMEKISGPNLFSDESAQKLGKLAGADVVIIGRFVVVQKKVRIQAKAIDVFSGRVSVTQNALSNLDGSIFMNIDKLATQMSEKMKISLPPLEQRIVFSETVLTRDLETVSHPRLALVDNLYVGIFGSYGSPIGKSANFFGSAYGGHIMFGASILSRYLNPFIIVGYELVKPNGATEIAYSGGAKANLEMQTYSVGSGLYYPFNVAAVILRPYLAAGIHAGTIRPAPFESFLVPSFRSGLIVDYFFSTRFGLSLGTEGIYLVEATTSLLFFKLSLGCSTRF